MSSLARVLTASATRQKEEEPRRLNLNQLLQRGHYCESAAFVYAPPQPPPAAPSPKVTTGETENGKTVNTKINIAWPPRPFTAGEVKTHLIQRLDFFPSNSSRGSPRPPFLPPSAKEYHGATYYLNALLARASFLPSPPLAFIPPASSSFPRCF